MDLWNGTTSQETVIAAPLGLIEKIALERAQAEEEAQEAYRAQRAEELEQARSEMNGSPAELEEQLKRYGGGVGEEGSYLRAMVTKRPYDLGGGRVMF